MIFAIFSLHSIVTYVAPYPFHQLNIIYLFLLWLLIRNQKTKALWLGLVFGYLTELFSAEFFGIHMITLLVSLFAASWMLNNVFTNLSWYIITALGFCAVLFYRIVFILMVFGSSLFKNSGGLTLGYWQDTVLIEIVVNTAGLLLVYITTSLIHKRTNQRYV